MNINPDVLKIRNTIIRTRRDFHKHPELSFQEFRTSKIVAERLEQYGLIVQKNIGKTGVVGILEGAHPVYLVKKDQNYFVCRDHRSNRKITEHM